jgi:hypothetical protein
MARGETCENLSKRTGVRIEWIRAIEAGQFQELPSGIYGRSAIRSHANALGLDATEVLAACATLLKPIEDPIAAMRRLNGVTTCETPAPAVPDRGDAALPDWRLVAASVIDAGAMAFTLLVVITATVAIGLPVSALDRSAGGADFHRHVRADCVLLRLFWRHRRPDRGRIHHRPEHGS